MATPTSTSLAHTCTRCLRSRTPQLSRQLYLPAISNSRTFSVLHRPPPNYPGHVPLKLPERLFLAAGSAIMSLIDPRRGDLIALLGETTAQPYFIYRLRDRMLKHPTGRRILRDRPRITSQSLSLPYLRSLPANTIGATYVSWLDREGVSPDTRSEVRYIDDAECAYVMQRYRECHDFYHAITGLPIVREGEIALKVFEYANTGLPMTGLSAFSTLTVKKDERDRLLSVYFPWAIRNGWKAESLLNVYWEEVLEKDVQEMRDQLGIEVPPDLRKTRAEIRKKRRQEKGGKVNTTATTANNEAVEEVRVETEAEREEREQREIERQAMEILERADRM
ncbi:Ubiquinone biosynthesis protein [Orbilia oligospora]|uniref:4-hydroxy-3-methoxy-5-polyprenylbenzoate decarboxylase n=1 Tax=Orbilia oligospora TaxID=2813651 RepID=A0A6G1MFZ7_ORBOL|nr:Ubiquinone biosynthesis protein [Orbilia oligospora]KAF3198911.1 Ubiquinone biosynthesis protein [Orbilia oligospora]KAF3222879.1 Ubiquinone biosynthesis protein [Orbilia oligospora]KAF3257195.1 Ubiquinone biosynthesis protein [Orbilia oligospora]